LWIPGRNISNVPLNKRLEKAYPRFLPYTPGAALQMAAGSRQAWSKPERRQMPTPLETGDAREVAKPFPQTIGIFPLASILDIS
jgi:hypothetical protein